MTGERMIKDCIRKGVNFRAEIRSTVNKRSNREISAYGVDLAINELIERGDILEIPVTGKLYKKLAISNRLAECLNEN